MSAALGIRICAALGCHRRTDVTGNGIVYARCAAHTLQVLSRAFAAPSRASEAEVPPSAVSGVLPVAAPVYRPAA